MSRPDFLGLFKELYFPIQSFWGQLLIPFTWKRWKAKQMLAQQGASAAPVPTASVSVDQQPAKLAV